MVSMVVVASEAVLVHSENDTAVIKKVAFFLAYIEILTIAILNFSVVYFINGTHYLQVDVNMGVS